MQYTGSSSETNLLKTLTNVILGPLGQKITIITDHKVMSKLKSFLDGYKSISQKTNVQKLQYIKCFLPEKGHYKLVKTAFNTGKLYSYLVYLMRVVIGMMHLVLSHFRDSRHCKEILLTDSYFLQCAVGLVLHIIK